jgi:hypothetical protein
MNRKFICLQLILGIFTVQHVFSQDETTDSLYSVTDTLQKDFGLFTHNDVLDLSLWFNITQYTNKKPKEEYLNAILTYYISKDDSINKEVRLKSRGEFRNGYCDFPPIVLNFKKTDFAKKDLSKLEKVKLVTHCQTRNEEYLFREYLVYRLYNVLTDNSFRVRLLRITYHNTYKAKKPIQTYGFFIEPVDILAERLNYTPVEAVNLGQKNILPEMMDRMAIFNYMIGNTDWSVPNQHNCKILSQHFSDRPELGAIVPYDFDYSGLVNAEYAVPYEGLGINSVRERIYQGLCRSEEDFLKTLKEFSDKKEEFYRVLREFDLLDEKQKKDMILYLDGFYKLFDNRNSIVNELLHSCKEY